MYDYAREGAYRWTLRDTVFLLFRVHCSLFVTQADSVPRLVIRPPNQQKFMRLSFRSRSMMQETDLNCYTSVTSEYRPRVTTLTNVLYRVSAAKRYRQGYLTNDGNKYFGFTVDQAAFLGGHRRFWKRKHEVPPACSTKTARVSCNGLREISYSQPLPIGRRELKGGHVCVELSGRGTKAQQSPRGNGIQEHCHTQSTERTRRQLSMTAAEVPEIPSRSRHHHVGASSKSWSVLWSDVEVDGIGE